MTATEARSDPYQVRRNLMQLHGERVIFNSKEVQEELTKKFLAKNQDFAPGNYVQFSVVSNS